MDNDLLDRKWLFKSYPHLLTPNTQAVCSPFSSCGLKPLLCIFCGCICDSFPTKRQDPNGRLIFLYPGDQNSVCPVNHLIVWWETKKLKIIWNTRYFTNNCVYHCLITEHEVSPRIHSLEITCLCRNVLNVFRFLLKVSYKPVSFCRYSKFPEAHKGTRDKRYMDTNSCLEM